MVTAVWLSMSCHLSCWVIKPLNSLYKDHLKVIKSICHVVAVWRSWAPSPRLKLMLSMMACSFLPLPSSKIPDISLAAGLRVSWSKQWGALWEEATRIRDKLKNAFINTLYKDQLGLPTTSLRLRIPLKAWDRKGGRGGGHAMGRLALLLSPTNISHQMVSPYIPNLMLFQRERQWLLLMAQATLWPAISMLQNNPNPCVSF